LAAQEGGGAAASPAPVPATAPAGSRAPAPAPAPATPAAAELNAFSLVVGPLLKEYGRPVALVALGLVHGWVLGRAVTIERFYRSARG
jgi:hypothetical protein